MTPKELAAWETAADLFPDLVPGADDCDRGPPLTEAEERSMHPACRTVRDRGQTESEARAEFFARWPRANWQVEPPVQNGYNWLWIDRGGR